MMQHRIVKGGYLIIALYFVLLLLLIRQAESDSQVGYVMMGLIPMFVYVYNRYKGNIFNTQAVSSYKYLLGFYALYYIIFAINFGAITQGIIILGITYIHILISSTLISKDNFITIKSTIIALLLLSLTVVFLPTYLLLKTLQFGAFYNFSDPSLLTTTTVDGPLIVALLFLLSSYDLMFNKKRSLLNFTAMLFSVFLLLLFSRRGFIFSSLLSIGFYYLCVKFKKKWLVYASISFMFLPMFWDAISTFLVLLSDSELFSTLISRNDSETLASATGRANAWIKILDQYFQFKSSMIFGYHGEIPYDLFPTDEEHGRYLHAHNTFLQMFLEGGYLLSSSFILLIIYSFKRYIVARRYSRVHDNFYFIVVLFLLNLSATETLVRDIKFSNFILCFAILAFNIYNEKTIHNWKTNSVTNG